MVDTKKKAFGTSRRAGTGTIKSDNSSASAQNWISSMSDQASNFNQEKKVLSKYIPTDYIHADPLNPRQLTLSCETVKAIAANKPINKAWLDEHSTIDWQDNYIKEVSQQYDLSGKALTDFCDLLEFAASLKSADRLLNPITVIKKDSSFQLIAGERRWLTHILLSEPSIAALIKDEQIERKTIDSYQWDENTQRTDMSLFERLEQVRRIADNYQGIQKVSVRELAKLIGKSKAVAQRYKAVLVYKPPQLLEAIREGKVTDLKKAAMLAQLTKAQLIAKLSPADPKKQTSKPLVKLAAKTNPLAIERIVKAATKELGIKGLANTEIKTLQEASDALNQLLLRVGDMDEH
jgi:ParB/RepB/Spo0J family partition protein